jgi:hypothetical protein
MVTMVDDGGVGALGMVASCAQALLPHYYEAVASDAGDGDR